MSYSALHNHSMYSLLDGFATPEEYFKRAKEIGLKAFAITEHGNEYSWCYFDKLKSKYPEIKIIYGVEFYECFDMSVKDKNSKYFHLIVLARNENGRKAINKLVTMSNFDGFYYKPRISIDKFKPYANDLVVTSACLASKLANENDYSKCIKYINEYKSIFPFFYLELQSHSHEEQKVYNQKILKLSKDTNTPYIITTDSHAATKEDLFYQGKHVQIAHDKETSAELYEGCYLQTSDEIHEIMDSQIGFEAVEVGLSTTNEISDLIEDVNMPFQSPRLPSFPLEEGFEENYDYLKYLLKKGWYQRGFDKLSDEDKQIYKERMEYELSVIHQMGFDGYFLIVWDFINYAKSKDVMVAPGRGSCAGSLVCFTIGITDLNPIKYGLIFQRFLNPERISWPDTDTDVDNRELVINYLIEKYGANRVCQIINFSYITPVVAIKDVGKILGFPYHEMDKLSKKFSYNTFQECLDNNEQFVLEHPQYKELFDIAGHLSGRVKTVSMHAGGVGIVDTDISDYMAMKLGKDGEHVIQVDKRIIEEIGIIKFDILGVQTLGMIKEIIQDTGLSEWDININNPEFEKNQSAYIVLNSAMTNGVFQVESAGMKDLLARLQVKSLSELSVVLALYRPDSMGALEEYIKRKNKELPIEYIHPDMIPILEETYGCLVYQEELLDIVKKFGGRSYGQADLFRKAIGKKDIDLVKTESDKLYNEILQTGYEENIAKEISDDLRQKGGYLFNKSHSVSYAVVCFTTAYLKAEYTLYFFKALFNMNIDKAGMINKYVLDAKQFNIEVLPPHLNNSQVKFSVYNGKILFGLSAIKGIGVTLAEQIVNERETNGKFTSLQNFIERIQPKKTQVISLIKSGAIPSKNKRKILERYLMSCLAINKEYKPVTTLPSPYSKLLEYGLDVDDYRLEKRKVDKVRLLADYNKIKEQRHQSDLSQKILAYQKECEEKYLQNEEFWEFEALQIFVNNNPFDKAYEYLTPFEDIPEKEKCTLVGIIAKVQKKKDKNKKQFAFVNLYSSFGLVEGIVWHTTYKENEDLIKKGQQVAILAKKENEEQVNVQKIKSYDLWLEQMRKRGDLR